MNVPDIVQTNETYFFAFVVVSIYKGKGWKMFVKRLKSRRKESQMWMTGKSYLIRICPRIPQTQPNLDLIPLPFELYQRL